MLKKLLTLLLLLCLCTGIVQSAVAQQPAGEASTIIIMRHAEKESGSDPDPRLSVAGKLRAGRLAELLKDVAVTKLMATPYKRTQQTLADLAAAKGLPIESYDPAALPALAQTLQESKGQTVVIAGHANTAPDLVNLLLAEKKYAQLNESEFGKIWVLTLLSGKAVSCSLINTN